MRNLIINQIHKEFLFKENIKIIYSIFDEINKNILLICSNMKIYFFSYKMFNYSKIEKEIEIESYLLNNSDLCLKIMTEIEKNNNIFIYLLYKSESDSLIIVLKTGEIITLNLTNQTSKILNFSSEFNSKIITFEPNPNQNNIILILSNFTLLNLNYDSLEIINKCILDDKDLSDYSKDLECSEAQISFRNNGETFTSIFKINDGYKNLVRDSNSLKIIKGPARADNKIVFSVAEAPLNYLSCNVAFMPNGSLIAFYDRKKGKIIFSEKNCLIHGEFKIVFNSEIINLEKIKVLILKWNFFSSMILFVFEYENKFYIQIYNRANYEWTLKYEIFSKEKVLNCVFSENNENQLLILFENNIFQIVDFIWEFSSSLFYNNNFNDNFGEIVVNNNNSKLKYTPIGKINVPPPLCLKTIENSRGKKFFWFRKFFFSVCDKNIEVYKSDFKEFFLFEKLEIKNVDFNIENVKKIIFVPKFDENFGIFVVNLIIDDDLNSEKLLFLIYEVEYKNFVIEKIKNEPKKIFETKIENINKIIIFNSNKFEKNYENEFYDENNILSKNTQILEKKEEKKFGLDLLENFKNSNENSNENSNSNEIYFYLTGFDLNSNEQIFTKVSFNLTNNNLKIKENSLNFTHNNKNEKIISIKSLITYKKEEILIYLTNNFNLYQNGNLLSNNINSFIIFKHFLLFIQNSSSTFSQLHIIDLNDDEIKNKLNNLYVQNLQYKNFNLRTLERGSSIVTCSNIKLILQLPRGNLETINLRLIVLDEVKKLLLNKKYDEAFYICKKNKINLNFIYDLNPNFFMNNLNVFINKINIDDINLFINSLINEKCDEYKILFNENKKNNNINNNEKINNICINIRKILFDLNNDDYISSILITFTKQNPPLYLNALQLIQKLKKEKKNSLAEKSLEFLCWIVNAETLFDFSLKTYDFELVIMCAKYTQKDPKEYLNYLNNLEEIKKKSPILMKYQINLDLKNYTDALIEISKGGEKFFDKCVELIEKYDLYDLALKLFNKPEFNNLFIKINELKGDFYYNKKNYEKSCLCYLNSNNFEKSFECYKKLGKINEAISLLFNLKKNNKENIYNILIDLINDCRIKKLENEIEKIYLFLINNIKIFTNEEIQNLILNLIECLINNKLFSFCYFIYINITNILKEENEKNKLIINEIEKKLLNEINLSFDLIYNSLKTNFNFFNEKYNRFETVQQLKKEHPEFFIIDLNKNDFNEIDNVSDSGSVRSSSSKKSSKTKKNKKKTTKKNIKEGSPLEEENLIEILKDLKIDEKEINKINELIDVLILLKLNEKSEELNKLKDDYVINVNNKINKMFLIEQIKFANEHPEINDLFPQLNLTSIINNLNDNNNNNNINIINIKKP